MRRASQTRQAVLRQATLIMMAEAPTLGLRRTTAQRLCISRSRQVLACFGLVKGTRSSSFDVALPGPFLLPSISRFVVIPYATKYTVLLSSTIFESQRLTSAEFWTSNMESVGTSTAMPRDSARLLVPLVYAGWELLRALY